MGVDLDAPNIDRLMAALRRQVPDRVPLLEMGVFSPTLDDLIGRSTSSAQGELTTVARIAHEQASRGSVLPRLVSEYPQPANNMTLSPEEYVTLCRNASFDAMVVYLSWYGLHGFLGTRGEYPDWEDLDRMVPPPHMSTVRDHLQRYIDAASDTGIGVGAIVHGCYARTAEAIGFENLALKLYDDVAFVETVMDIYASYARDVAETVADMDIAFFWIFDDIADNNGCQIRPSMLEQLWFPRMQRILEPIKAKKIPILYHCDGNLKDVIPMAIRLGVDALQPIQPNCNDIYEIKRSFGDRLCLIGNVDISGVLVFGSPEEVRADARRHIERLGPGGGYVLGSGHSITSDVPPANFRAMRDAARRFGRYPIKPGPGSR
jgi:uroporphyrinogen decarboxylase